MLYSCGIYCSGGRNIPDHSIYWQHYSMQYIQERRIKVIN